MNAIMNTEQFTTFDQIRDFLAGTQEGAFSMPTKAARYAFLRTMLIRFKYRTLSKADKGLLLRFLSRVSGYSKVQVKRLVQQYVQTGKLQCRQRTAAPFTRKYTPADIRLLAQTDAWHDTLSGPATRKLCERAYTVFGDSRYERLAELSVAHLYNLRRTRTYTGQRVPVAKTRPVTVAIGERR
ncbi:MAG: integrase, partial [Proteobacteria bacterium]|nr:integrase [Pseudomonadota bacterium]